MLSLIEQLKEEFPNATLHGHNEFANKAYHVFKYQKNYNRKIQNRKNNRKHILVTNHYLRCFALTHGKTRRRKSDPLIIPEAYDFLEGLD